MSKQTQIWSGTRVHLHRPLLSQALPSHTLPNPDEQLLAFPSAKQLSSSDSLSPRVAFPNVIHTGHTPHLPEPAALPRPRETTLPKSCPRGLIRILSNKTCDQRNLKYEINAPSCPHCDQLPSREFGGSAAPGWGTASLPSCWQEPTDEPEPPGQHHLPDSATSLSSSLWNSERDELSQKGVNQPEGGCRAPNPPQPANLPAPRGHIHGQGVTSAQGRLESWN